MTSAQMTKVVFNSCFGGFGLSEQAVRRYAEIKGIALYPAPFELHGQVMPSLPPTYWLIPPSAEREYSSETVFHDRDIDRSDPALIQVIEELGAAANGRAAKLEIAEIPSGTLYRIDEYDGNETVATQDSYEWSVAK